jgi:hypothetical protein
MEHECRIPAWLLRDLPALAGMFVCLWLFVIALITDGFRLISGGTPCQQKFDVLVHPLLAAETRLAYALWREAYRRLGDNPGLVKLGLADLPVDDTALIARIRSSMDEVQNLSRASAHHTDILRWRWGASVHAAHGSTGALRAAHHEAVGFFASNKLRSAIAPIPEGHLEGRGRAQERPQPARFSSIADSIACPHLSAPACLRTPVRA